MPEHNRDSTFVFADIAGYTALTEAHGDEQAADLAASFCHAVTKLAVVHGGQVVKTIGDAVMVRVEEPASAVELGLRVAGEVMADHGFPAVRVGMHHGPAVEREGDWFGSAVNLAARVAGLASGGEVLITGAVRAAAEGIEDVRFEDRGEQRLRNVPVPIALFAATRNGTRAEERDLDPVCRMIITPGREAGTVEYEGTRYRLCSLDCVARFASDPEAYVAR